MSRYAVVGQWTMQLAKAEEQQRELNERIVPLVRESPGFVEGRWTRQPDGRHVSFVVFDDEASATSFAEFVRGEVIAQEAAGVSNDSLEVYELIASA
jgi:antibiotic biosynthesis monooxygenase (ABM) superfamily enzyme